MKVKTKVLYRNRKENECDFLMRVEKLRQKILKKNDHAVILHFHKEYAELLYLAEKLHPQRK